MTPSKNFVSPEIAGSAMPALARGCSLAPTFLLFSVWPFALALQGCSTSVATVDLADGPVPVRLKMTPAAATRSGPVHILVTSPNADSIEIRSADGLDRYSVSGPALRVSLPSTFGDSTPLTRYALRENGHLFDVLKKPMNVTVCRNRTCRQYYHELAVRLPERNLRRLAITGGWSTAFTSRAVRDTDRDMLMRDVRDHSVWNLRAEMATGTTSARLLGFFGAQEHGGSLDLAHAIRASREGPGYGLAFHLAATGGERLPVVGPALPNRGTTYQASVGPAIMLKGLTFSSQFGLYIDGGEMLQELSTLLSFNGGFTDVRYPFTLTVERRLALGNEPVIARRRDELQRLTVGVDVIPGVALLLRMASHRSAWPTALRSGQVLLDEMYYTLGAEYTLGW